MAKSQNNKNKLVVLIPAYNEAATITSVINSIPKRLAGVSQIKTIVIDDGSTDRTAALAKRAGAEVITHHHNQGVGQALQSGLEAALKQKADYVVNIDADGQFAPINIRQLLQPLSQAKADVTVASRFLNSELTPPMPRTKYYGNRLLSWLMSAILRQRLTDVTCGFRAYNRQALLKLQLFGRFTYTQEMFISLAKNNLTVQEVALPVLPTKRPNGESRVVTSLFSYTWRVVLIVLRALRDYKPAIFFGLPAAGLFLLGTLAGTFTLWHYLSVGSITPYKSLAIIALFALLASLLLILVALLADMFDRMRILQERIIYHQRQSYYEK